MLEESVTRGYQENVRRIEEIRRMYEMQVPRK